jgi:hypothetical protein
MADERPSEAITATLAAAKNVLLKRSSPAVTVFSACPSEIVSCFVLFIPAPQYAISQFSDARLAAALDSKIDQRPIQALPLRTPPTQVHFPTRFLNRSSLK